MSKQQAAAINIGFGGLLTLVFIAAKLWDRIDWSWWWVCSPLWVPTGLVLGFLVSFVTVVGVAGFVTGVVRAIGRKLRGPRNNGL